MALTMADANKALAAAIKSAEDVNIKLCVAVCDVGGRLIAFNRMDGAGWASIYGAQGKALASAATGAPSGSLPADHPVMIRIVELEGGNMVLGQGGVPIRNSDSRAVSSGTLPSVVASSRVLSEPAEEPASRMRTAPPPGQPPSPSPRSATQSRWG